MRDLKQVEELIQRGKHFCIYPWVHLYVDGHGTMLPCCVSASKGYGSLNISSIKELWQGENIRKFRLKMLEDKMDEHCYMCYENEKSGCISNRMKFNSFGSNYINWVANTDESGYAPDAKPISWDIRFSNKCNLRCRTCSSYSSSAWYGEEEALRKKKHIDGTGVLYNEALVRKFTGLNDSKRLLSDLEEYLPYAYHIYCAGGEPLLIDENMIILQQLDSIKKYDVMLVYNTNMTLIHQKSGFLPYWKKMKNLMMFVSLDGSHQRGEYIRKGINWDCVVKNLEILKKECPHAIIVINFTVSVFNILHLPDFHKEIIEKGYLRADGINLNILHFPDIYNIKILPENLKELAALRIKDHISWLREQPPYNDVSDTDYSGNGDFDSQWQACINHMYAEDWSHLIPQFLEHTNELDELRNEKFADVFPELEQILSK